MLDALIALDENLFATMNQWAAFVPEAWKLVAIWGVYAIPITLIASWFWFQRVDAFRAGFAGVLAWQGFNNLIASVVNRARPVSAIDLHFPEREFLFDRPGPSFPSDHAAFMTAVALSLWLSGERRLSPWLAALSMLTLLARVVTAQHWPGDILVGLFVGLSTAGLVWHFRASIDHYISKPLVGLAQRIGL